MTKRQIVKLEMFRRVRDYGTKHQAHFPQGSSGAQAFSVIANVLDGMSAGHKAKLAAAQEGFRTKKVVRVELRQQLEHIEMAARTIARTRPGYDDGFRLPERLNDQVLQSAAKLFLDKSAPLAAELTAFGLPDNFIERLQTTLQRFEAAIAACEDGNRESASAQAAIEADIAAGMEAITRLEIIIANTFRDDVSARAQWTRDRQQRAAYRQRPQDTTNHTQPTTTSGPTVAPTSTPTAKGEPPAVTAAVAGAFESALRGDSQLAPSDEEAA